MKEDDTFDGPYLPARYREIIRKKKQRRMLRKIGIIAGILVAITAVLVLVTGIPGGSPGPAPAATTPPVSGQATPTVTATTIPAATTAKTPVPTAITTTKTSVTPVVTPTASPEPVLTAIAGLYATPQPETAPAITQKQAESIALAAFPNLPAGVMSVEQAATSDYGQVWKYTLRADTTVEASGLIDMETGTVLTFNRTINPGGRPQNPVLTMGNARQIADSTINSRNNGILTINMSDGRYIPLPATGGTVAGTYRFVYKRMIQDYPCDADGFIVSVDAVTGAITEWAQRWQTPDNAFMVIETPVVAKYDAIFTVQEKAKSLYPASISSVRILTSERCWKDAHDPAVTPRPSTIPLAWKVIFDDETIRDIGTPPAVAWVDTHSGALLDITYRH